MVDWTHIVYEMFANPGFEIRSLGIFLQKFSFAFFGVKLWLSHLKFFSFLWVRWLPPPLFPIIRLFLRPFWLSRFLVDYSACHTSVLLIKLKLRLDIWVCDRSLLLTIGLVFYLPATIIITVVATLAMLNWATAWRIVSHLTISALWLHILVDVYTVHVRVLWQRLGATIASFF